MKRYLASIMISFLISALGATAGQRTYEVGAVYIYYSWTTDAQIVHDLETIAATGINTINPYPSFLLSYGNPEPDFSKTDLILKTAQRLGLRIMPTVYWSRLLPDFAAARGVGVPAGAFTSRSGTGLRPPKGYRRSGRAAGYGRQAGGRSVLRPATLPETCHG
jgi:hypothetical protein